MECIQKDATIFFRKGSKGNFKRYIQPFIVDKSINLSTYARKGDKKSAVISTDFHKRNPNLKIKLYSDYVNQFSAGGNNALIDGLFGTEDFRTGTWQGYSNTDLHAVVDLGKDTLISNVKISFLRDQRSWIFLVPAQQVDWPIKWQVELVILQLLDQDYLLTMKLAEPLLQEWEKRS